MKSEIKKVNIIPGTDPQDPGFDVVLGYLATRNPTTSEPLIYNGYPFLQQLWQAVQSNDNFATYATTGYYLCPDNTADSMVWWKIVFDANILQVINSVGWEINTARQPSLTNDTFVVSSINQNNTLLTTTSCTAQISADNSTWITVGSVGDTTGVASNKTSLLSFLVPAGYYYRLESSGSGTVTLSSCNELTM